ncbi:MAG: radical SAM family heme chaperone HemW [Deltaproteobacteria bacterium]|nr:radical SAM family heme chaperone HemW [Deltaproteobacteria bacterium]
MDHSRQSYQCARSLTNQFGVYLHVPYCRHRCSYCDFFSSAENHEFGRFAKRIAEETAQAAVWWQELAHSRVVDTVFFGGGTPSLLSVPWRAAILDALSRNLTWGEGVEVTLETNPETVDTAFVDSLLESGVNRLSLGVQSFSQEFLDRLDRRCRPESVFEATRLIRASGWKNWSLDLIMGIPGQSAEDLKEDLETALALEPTHMSVYTLTLKPGHILYKDLPDEDLSADLFELARDTLAANGFRQYEISNFAKPGFECRHNLLYWSGSDFLGLGPSAASRYFAGGVFHHRKQVADLNRYFSQKDVREVAFESTTREQAVLEAAFLELRKDDGIDCGDFRRRFGVDLRHGSRVGDLASDGLLETVGERLWLTDRGRLLADSVAPALVGA